MSAPYDEDLTKYPRRKPARATKREWNERTKPEPEKGTKLIHITDAENLLTSDIIFKVDAEPKEKGYLFRMAGQLYFMTDKATYTIVQESFTEKLWRWIRALVTRTEQ